MNNSQAQWNATDADDDVTRNNIAHGFLSTKEPSAAPGLEQLLRLFLALMPEELHTFSVARSATLNKPFCLCHQVHLPPVMQVLHQFQTLDYILPSSCTIWQT